MNTNNDHKTPEESEIPYLKLAKQLGLQRRQGKPQYNVVPPGRPFFTAHIPLVPWEIEELRFKYNDIIRELTYREAMAWCRGFGYSYATFLMRRYYHRNPKLEEIIITVGWYDAGKPVVRKNRNSVARFDQLVEGLKKINTRGCSTEDLSTSPSVEHPL